MLGSQFSCSVSWLGGGQTHERAVIAASVATAAGALKLSNHTRTYTGAHLHSTNGAIYSRETRLSDIIVTCKSARKQCMEERQGGRRDRDAAGPDRPTDRER